MNAVRGCRRSPTPRFRRRSPTLEPTVVALANSARAIRPFPRQRRSREGLARERLARQGDVRDRLPVVWTSPVPGEPSDTSLSTPPDRRHRRRHTHQRSPSSPSAPLVRRRPVLPSTGRCGWPWSGRWDCRRAPVASAVLRRRPESIPLQGRSDVMVCPRSCSPVTRCLAAPASQDHQGSGIRRCIEVFGRSGRFR